MSSAKSAVPAIAVYGVIAVPALAGAAAVACAAVLAARAIENRRAAELEKARLAAWQEIEKKRRERSNELNRSREEIHMAGRDFADLSELSEEFNEKALGSRREERQARGSTQKGFDHPGPKGPKSARDLKSMINLIGRMLKALPEEFKDDENWPYQRFEKQQKNIIKAFKAGKHPLEEELYSFQQAISRTMDRFLETGMSKVEAGERLFRSADDLLNEILVCRHAAVDNKSMEELDYLREEIIRLAEKLEFDHADLDLVQKRFNEIKQKVEADNQWRAFRGALAESIVKHLDEMGYKSLQTFQDPENYPGSRAVLAVPGGERLNVVIESDGRMNFELAHEKRDYSALTDEEIAFYRRQEDMWSRDFQELIRRLAKEGFSYQVQSEDFAASDSIPIAILETADEILDEEDYRPVEPEARRRDN